MNLRLTPAEAEGVRRLVEHQAEQLRPLGIDPTMTSVVRGLIRKAIAELDGEALPEPPPKRPAKKRGAGKGGR